MTPSTADYRRMAYAAGSTKPDRDSNDWHTPARCIEAARIVLERIDLDPFSSAIANQTVKADRFLSESDNSLHPRHWSDRPITVWANPPYGRGIVDAAIARFLVELPRLSAASAVLALRKNRLPSLPKLPELPKPRYPGRPRLSATGGHQALIQKAAENGQIAAG